MYLYITCAYYLQYRIHTQCHIVCQRLCSTILNWHKSGCDGRNGWWCSGAVGDGNGESIYTHTIERGECKNGRTERKMPTSIVLFCSYLEKKQIKSTLSSPEKRKKQSGTITFFKNVARDFVSHCQVGSIPFSIGTLSFSHSLWRLVNLYQ